MSQAWVVCATTSKGDKGEHWSWRCHDQHRDTGYDPPMALPRRARGMRGGGGVIAFGVRQVMALPRPARGIRGNIGHGVATTSTGILAMIPPCPPDCIHTFHYFAAWLESVDSHSCTSIHLFTCFNLLACPCQMKSHARIRPYYLMADAIRSSDGRRQF